MKVGLQEITVKQYAENNFKETVEKISAIGYKYVEWLNTNADIDAGLGFGIAAEEAKAVFDSYGIKLIGGLIVPSDLEKDLDKFLLETDKLKRVVDWYASINCETIGIALEFFPSLDYLNKRCEAYNRLGSICKSAGLQLTYHNHYHEFQEFNGRVILDLILENTDADLLGIELDVYWAMRALQDPAKLIRKLGKNNRIKLLHTKDFPINRCDNLNVLTKLNPDKAVNLKGFFDLMDPEDFIEAGEGIIKIQDVIDAGNEFNVPYIFVEQDFTKLPVFDSILVTLNNMKQMRGLDWK